MSLILSISAPVAQAIAANLNPLSSAGIDGTARLLPGIAGAKEPLPTIILTAMAPLAPAVVSVLRRYPDWSSGNTSTSRFLGGVALETVMVLGAQIAGFAIGESAAMMTSPQHALSTNKPWRALAVGALVRIGLTTGSAWGLVRIFFG